jgi:hypothetical protein
MTKNRLLSIALGGAFGLGLVANIALANPLLPPITAPVPVTVSTPTVTAVPGHTQVLNAYRQVRAFWLSRAIVR